MEGGSVEVLHRESGYLRLRFPPQWRTAAVGATLEDGLKTLAGVRRVTWLTAEGRLAVRFDPHACTHADVARCIKTLLAGLSQPAAMPAAPAPSTDSPPASLASRLDELRERLVGATPARFRPIVESATTEKAIINFFNDVLAFYLIKVHWELIVDRWIKDPVKYGNAWLTVFYLVFLLVRYRKS